MRINDNKVEISEGKVLEFFKGRAEKYQDENPYVSMLYQDLNPVLANERNEYEVNKILPYFNLHPHFNVLDVGCGIGRWGDVLDGQIKIYHGTDFSEELIHIANERFKDKNNFSFYNIAAQRISEMNQVRYNLIIVAGVLHYINNEDLDGILISLEKLLSNKGILYIRLPIALGEDLTLLDEWSEELEDSYNAIYRSKKYYLDLFEKCYGDKNMEIIVHGDLYPSKLNNRKETGQYYFLLRKVKK